MKIAVRAGHTVKSPGVSVVLDEVKESRKIKPMLIAYLKSLGHTVMDVTPSDDTPYPNELTYGVNKANDWGADFFVSVHFNLMSKTAHNIIKGSEVCVKSEPDIVAKRVCEKLASLGFNNRGTKTQEELERSLGELNYTNMDAIIVEVCFVDSKPDAEVYFKNGPHGVAKAIAEGITNQTVTIDITE